MNLADWKKRVEVNNEQVRSLIDDRMTLKDEIAEHLKQYFEYDEIDFSQNMGIIYLKWKWGNDPVIRNGTLNELGMDFIISYKEGVVLELYPFGVKEGVQS